MVGHNNGHSCRAQTEQPNGFQLSEQRFAVRQELSCQRRREDVAQRGRLAIEHLICQGGGLSLQTSHMCAALPPLGVISVVCVVVAGNRHCCPCPRSNNEGTPARPFLARCLSCPKFCIPVGTHNIENHWSQHTKIFIYHSKQRQLDASILCR